MNELIVVLGECQEAKKMAKFFAEHGVIVEFGASESQKSAELIEEMFIGWDQLSKDGKVKYESVLFYKDHMIPKHMSRVCKDPICVFDFIEKNEIPDYFANKHVVFKKSDFHFDTEAKTITVPCLKVEEFKTIKKWFTTFNVYIEQASDIQDKAS